MEGSGLSLDLLKETMRAWRRGEDAPAIWLDSFLVGRGKGRTSEEQQLWLKTHVTNQVLTMLAQRRQETGLREGKGGSSREALLASLAADFRGRDAQLEAWSALYHRYLAPLHLSVSELAEAAAVDVRTFNRRATRGLSLLLEQLQREEEAARAEWRSTVLKRYLPAPQSQRLYGVEPHVARLIGWLQEDDGPPIISIEGIGGIGKTALALHVAQRIAMEGAVAGISWVSARHEWFTEAGEIKKSEDGARSLDDVISRLAAQLGQEHLAGMTTVDKVTGLKSLLASTPHLVVIDNLETLSDRQALLPAIGALAGNSRFVLTSRHTMRYHSRVQLFAVPTLTLEDSRRLVEDELARNGRAAQLAADEMALLYGVTGGLPLALKLAAGQMAWESLPAVLDGLRRVAPMRDSEATVPLYRYIYRRAWQMLDDGARTLLLAMVRVAPDGEDSDWIQMVSGLEDGSFQAALRQLLDLSLLEVSGSLSRPVYRLHRLTATFLQTDVIEEQDDTGRALL